MTAKGFRKLLTKPDIFLRDYIKKHKDTKEKLKIYVGKLIDINVPFHQYYYGLFLVLNKGSFFYTAEKPLKKAITLKPKALYYYELGVLLKRKNQWWQVADAMNKAIELKPNADIKWYLAYAEALEKMNRFEEASTVLEKFAQDNKLDSNWYFTYGNLLEKASKKDQAQIAFSKAIELDTDKNSQALGVGIFYEKRGYWSEASIKYAEALKENPFDADLMYRYALSLDRIYSWSEAEEAYKNAIVLKPENINLYYRLGFVQERQKKYEKATESYSYAAKNRKNHTPYWYYRLGYVLNKAGKYKKACRAFLAMKKLHLPNEKFDLTEELFEKNIANLPKKSQINSRSLLLEENTAKIISLIVHYLNEDTTRVDLWHKLAKAYLNIEDYKNAEYAYKRLLERQEEFASDLYFEFGHVLALQQKYDEASKAFIEQRIIQDANGISEKPFNNDAKLKKVMSYTYYYERFNIEKDTILYESYHGRSISCSPYAIFKSLLTDKRFKNFKHIWVMNEKDRIPKELKNNHNIIFIKRDCDTYMRYLAKTEYLINNSTFPDYYIRKENQKYINTWHGTPIKYMGKNIQNDFMSHKNVTKNFLHTTMLIQPNTYTTDILLNSHDINGIYNGVIAETGYPRQDLMLNILEDEKKQLIDNLNLDKEKKIVLYAPTWRGTFADADFDSLKLKQDIEELQEIKNIQIIFRGHYAAEKAIDSSNLNIVVVPSSIDTNKLLSIVDILITDYSSICFDFMARSKPILYYAYDKTQYINERGLYFELEELGGEISTNISDLKESLISVVNNYKINKVQKRAEKKFCYLDDGNATKRVINLIFFDKKDNIKIISKSNKKSILFYGGDFNPNGINTSFINLLNHIDKSKYEITVVVDPNVVNKIEKRLEQFNRLDRNIKVIGRVGRMTLTLQEQWIKNKFDTQRTLTNNEQWNIYKILFGREFRRIFGYGNFDAIVDFNGYGVFWPSLFANQQNNAIYQHNDMHGEWIVKFSGLENLFRLYPLYNKLISVSKDTMHHNINNLADKFNLSNNVFKYCDNVQNYEYTLKNAMEPLDDEKIFKNSKVFINIARLSPEKDQEKLIRAFKKVVNQYPNAKLINLGSGPLEHHLKSIIKELKLEKKVFLLGQKFNPYPYLKKADCFVLSSNHEGQPMTLFEAMILKKPIIATDIVGNRSVLEGRPGLLIENSEKGLYHGMLDFLEGRYIEEKEFDYDEYNQNALDDFYQKVLGEKL